MTNVLEFTGKSLLDVFYKAGEDLAAKLRTDKGETRTSFTAKELAIPVYKGGPALIYPEAKTDGETPSNILYFVNTDNSRYQMAQEDLFEMMAHMESCERLKEAKRRRFTIRNIEKEQRDVVARATFDADKMLPKLKKCWDATDSLRPCLQQPALELKTGVIVCSNGHILAVHKARNYHIEMSGEPMEDTVFLPREVTQMKGAITIEVENKKFEYTVHQSNGKDVTTTTDGLLVTATDANGKQADVRQEYRYPNWRSTTPQRVGKAIEIDAKLWGDTAKRIAPQVNQASFLMWLDAEKGSEVIAFKGENYDFSKDINISVPLSAKLPFSVLVGMKTPALVDTMAFEPKVMHYTDSKHAVMFVADDTYVILMPMLLPDGSGNGSGPQDQKDFITFSVDKWIGQEAAPIEKPKPAAKAKAATKTKTVAQAAKTEPTLEERLREALEKQLLVAA